MGSVMGGREPVRPWPVYSCCWYSVTGTRNMWRYGSLCCIIPSEDGGGGVTNSYNTCLKIYHFVLKSEVDVIADTVSHYCISSCTVFPGVKVTMVNKYCNMSILIINFFLLQIPMLEQKTLTAETYDWSTLTSDNYRHASNWFLQTCDPRCVLAERSSSMALGLRLESLENDEINLCTALNRSLLFS